MFKASRVLQGDVLDTSAGEFFPLISANYCIDEAVWLNELICQGNFSCNSVCSPHYQHRDNPIAQRSTGRAS